MSIATIALLFVAGFLSGVVNAIAGGGTFLTFGAMTLAGLPPIAANATSSITQFPGYITSTLAYRREFAGLWKSALILGLVSALGALGGVLTAPITFTSYDAGVMLGLKGFAAAMLGGLGSFGGAVVGGLKFKKAETILTMIDNRSGVQLAAAQGQARKTDFGGGIAGWGGSGYGALGGYTNTPEGKVLAAAFADAYNNLVRALRNYEAQEVEGGLGKGGKLKVGN